MSYRKVVAGVDGSATSLEALRQAAQLAGATSSELVAVFAAPEGRDTSEVESKAKEVGAAAGVELSFESAPGDPAEVLIKVAEEQEADLLVVGNKGMTGASRFLLGSVPNKVSHHSPCDLLIIRTT